MGAAYNNLMEEETKESLAEMCCTLMDEIATLKLDSTLIITTPFPFLDSDFLTLMNDIGRLGHEKFKDDAFEAHGDRVRRILRHQKREVLTHAREHIWLYDKGVRHDHFGDLKHQLAAAAFNCLMEFYFSQGE
jgi:hypothetical protein